MAGKPGRPTRRQTDAGLKVERDKTDEELARRRGAAEEEADRVAKVARARAAKVLQTARGREDRRMKAGDAADADRGRIAKERARADVVLRREYARADAVVAGERAQRARLEAVPLANERADTDRRLLLERDDVDEIIGRRDEFLGMVSHDLRNELTAIDLSVAALLGNVTDDEPGRNTFRSAITIQRVTLRMNRLIGDLLDIVSIDAGKLAIVPECRDVCRSVHDVAESFAPSAAAKGISLTVRGVHNSVQAELDHQRIQQVLGNLLNNALKYTAEGGTVAVSTERKAGAIWFVVTDSGSGIAADRLESIFERFSGGMRPQGNGRGLGLGLYIARHIVEAHGGRIWAESEPGRGSTFRVTLPFRPPYRQAVTDQSRRGALNAKPRARDVARTPRGQATKAEHRRSERSPAPRG